MKKSTQLNSVVNISNHPLSKPQLALLNKGLGFCPTLPNPDPIKTLRDTYLFNRKLRLLHHFQGEPYTPTTKLYKQPSGWTPKANVNKDLDKYINVITEEITNNQTTNTNKPHRNLHSDEFTAIKELRNNQDIIIKPADKGGAVVVMNKTDYLNEVYRQLNDESIYKKVEDDLNPQFIKKFTDFLNITKNKMDKNLEKYLIPKQWRTPIFYTLPKIHKPGNPGRPIVSAIDAPTSRMSEVTDDILKPLIKNINSYIRDTNEFLMKIKNISPVPANSILITADVSALYTSIPHREGLLATKEMLDTRDEQTIPTWMVLRWIHFILTCNCFRFENNYYLQKRGTSMGTKMAPEYAIIFMDKLERNFLNTQPHKPLVWYRYIDNIFMIWPHNREALDAFMSDLNDFHHSIKFTFEISETSIPFLDTRVIIDKEGNLTTTLYKKPTDANLYLHYKSCHPLHQKNSIPYSQAIRIRRICSTIDDYQLHTQKMKENFIKRGYPRKS